MRAGLAAPHARGQAPCQEARLFPGAPVLSLPGVGVPCRALCGLHAMQPRSASTLYALKEGVSGILTVT